MDTGIRAAPSPSAVEPGAPVDGVVSPTATDEVVASTRDDGVVAGAGVDDVSAFGAQDGVVGAGALYRDAMAETVTAVMVCACDRR